MVPLTECSTRDAAKGKSRAAPCPENSPLLLEANSSIE